MIRMPAVGDQFGRYRLVRELGHGGMGVVYLARDTELDRDVALKIIVPQLAGDADYRARFKREATALTRMDSPHIVAVHDHGELDGCLYLVTQLVPHGDLLQQIAARAVVSYTEWRSVGTGVDRFTDQFGQRGCAWRSGWGYTWSKASRKDGASRANLYDRVPMSVNVEGGSEKARNHALDRIEYRKPKNLRGRPV